MKLKFQLIITLIVIEIYTSQTSGAISSHDYEEDSNFKSIEDGRITDKSFESLKDEDEISFLDTFNALNLLNLAPFLSEITAINVSEKCAGDLQYVFKNLGSQGGWAANSKYYFVIDIINKVSLIKSIELCCRDNSLI